MSQHDYNIANAGGAAVRGDINNALAAILSQNSGAAEPTTTAPFMLWYDTTNNLLKIRNRANTAWEVLKYSGGQLGAASAFIGSDATEVQFAADIGPGTRYVYTYVRATDYGAYDYSNSKALWSVDNSANFKINSGFGSLATAYGCRAWVNFNGQGTVAIRSSGNVSSITDNGTGDYTINFTNAMPDANYAVVGTHGGVANGGFVRQPDTPSISTSSVRLWTLSYSSVLQDPSQVSVSVFR